MIQSLKVINSYGEELTMTLNNPHESGYVIAGITGLEPVQVDIKQSQMVSGRKYRYNKGFHKYRDITLSIIYDEWNNKSIEELRSNLYRYFMTDDLVELYFIKDGHYASGNYVKNDGSMQPGNYGITDEYGNIVNFILRSDGFFYLNDSTYDGAVLKPFVDENYTETETAYIDALGRLYWNGSETMIWFWEDEIWSYFNIISQSHSNLGEIRTIKGHVSAHNATYFSQSCGAQITITCSDPWFKEAYEYNGETKTQRSYDIINAISTAYVVRLDNQYENYKGDISNGFSIDLDTTNTNLLNGADIIIFSEHINGDGVMITTNEIRIKIPANYIAVNSSSTAISTHLYINIANDNLIIKDIGNNYEFNAIGWVYASSISSRQDFPNLKPGYNRVHIISTKPLTGNDGVYGTLYLENLYRGL